MRGVGVIFREAIATARSQPVVSAITVVMLVGTIVAVMLTTGRAVGAEQRVLGTLDDLGTRSIVVRADDGAHVTSSVLERLSAIEGVEWAAAFTSATDAVNTLVPDGVRVPTRRAFGENLETLGIPLISPDPGSIAYASMHAFEQLGMVDGAGGITLTTGEQYSIGGELTVPEFMEGFEPLVLIPPSGMSGDELVNLLVIVAASPELVSPVASAALSVVGADDPTKVSAATSENLANLRATIGGQLGALSRSLVIGLVSITGVLVAALLYGLVIIRRKDFGRRRALGASRSFIVGLLLAQTALLSLVGIGAGLAVSSLVLIGSSDPLPGLDFVAGVSVLTLIVALASACLPAILASRREPIRELRVP